MHRTLHVENGRARTHTPNKHTLSTMRSNAINPTTNSNVPASKTRMHTSFLRQNNTTTTTKTTMRSKSDLPAKTKHNTQHRYNSDDRSTDRQRMSGLKRIVHATYTQFGIVELGCERERIRNHTNAV